MPKKKKKKKFSEDLWSSARTKYHLSSRQIEMAKKLGFYGPFSGTRHRFKVYEQLTLPFIFEMSSYYDYYIM